MLLWTMPNGQKRQVEEGSTLLPFAKDFAAAYGSPIVEGLFNNKAVDLQRPIYDDGVVDFIEVNDEQGMRVYTRTLLFMALTAAQRLYPKAALEVRNTLGSALYLADMSKHKLTEQEIKNIEAEMKRMAAEKTA
ncbi:threonyl-tRNA synthetase, partial [gut metagenome]